MFNNYRGIPISEDVLLEEYCLHCRSGLGEEYQSHSEKDHRHRSRHDDESRKRERYSHSRSPVPPRGGSSSRDRGDRPHRGGSLKREASSGRNSPMFIDERSRNLLRDDPRYGGREVELEEGGRYHERLSGGSSRLLTVREDSRYGGGDRRGSREMKDIYERERSGHHRDLLKPIRSSSVRVGGERGGERGGGYSLLRDDGRPSLKGSRSSPRRPIELSDRARPSRREVPSSNHYSHSVKREHQRERHHKTREECRERHHKGHHHRNRREAAGEEKESSTVASTVETVITISSESGEEEEGERGREGRRGRVEKIEDLIRDIESGSSSGEISEGESEGEGGASPGSKDDSSSEKEKSSDGMLHVQL